MDPVQQQAMIQALLTPQQPGVMNAMGQIDPSQQAGGIPQNANAMMNSMGGLPNPTQQQPGGLAPLQAREMGMMGMMPPGINGPPAAYTGY